MRIASSLLVAAAALLATADLASARAPSASDQKSLDWVLDRIQKDRQEDSNAPVKVDPVTAYRTGESPLEGWSALTDIIENPQVRYISRDAATVAILDRFRHEDGQKRVDARALLATKVKICLKLLPMMTSDDSSGRGFVHRLTTGLLPPEHQVPWDPGGTPQSRKKAQDALRKKLK